MKFYEKEKKNILFCLIITFIIGFVAHGYMFFNNSVSHDYLNELVYNSEWKNSLGRIFPPFYIKLIRGDVVLPLLVGFLGILFLAMSVYLITKIFDIKNKIITVLICGIMTVNVTVISTIATYLGDFDCNMLALFLSVLSVFLFTKFKKGYLYGIIPLCLSIGSYQSFISVTISLLIIYFIKKLMNNEDHKKVLSEGLKAILMIILGGILYFIILKVYLFILGSVLNNGYYNSLSNMSNLTVKGVILSIIDTYKVTIKGMIMPKSILTRKIMFVIHMLLYIVPGLLFIKNYLFNKKYNLINKVYIMILLLILPLGMNISKVLCNNMSHDIMHYAFNFSYLFVIVVVIWLFNNKCLNVKRLKYVPLYVVAILFMVLFLNIRTANAAYVLKDYEQDANMSYYTRLLDSIEKFDGYNEGETEVVFIGRPKSLISTNHFANVYNIAGMNFNSHIMGSANPDYYSKYFKYVMLNPLKVAPKEIEERMKFDKRVIEMEVYPSSESIKFIDGILVVKQG